MRSELLGLLCVVLPLTYGCSGVDATGNHDPSNEPGSQEPTAQSAGASTSTVLAHVNLSDTHVVEIMASDDGVVSIVEKGAIGVDKASLDPKADQGKPLVALYEQLQRLTTGPKGSTVDMERLQALDEVRATALLKQTPAAPVQDEIVEKASLWANYLSSNHAYDSAWAWWSSGPCNRHTYRCEFGLSGGWTFTKADDYITYAFANYSTTNTTGSADIRHDPCYNAPFFEFCTKPWKTDVSITVAPLTWSTMWSYSNDGGNLKYAADGSSDLFAWSITYDNPRTW